MASKVRFRSGAKKMPVDVQKRAIGVFENRETTEAALNELKNADFPMNQVSVVAKDVSKDDKIASNPDELIQNNTAEGLGKGILTGGALGGVGGLLVGLGTLAVPGIGPIVLAGAQAAIFGAMAGGFYGAAAGGIIGAVLGNGVPNEEVTAYSDRLAKGNYLIILDGSDKQIDRAQSILQSQSVRDWRVYGPT